MVVGNTSKGEDMEVNPGKAKQLSNYRSAGKDDATVLTPPWEITIERGLEVMREDDYLEITPESVRLRKKLLTTSERAKKKK
jgi:GTP-binding protein